MPHSTLNFTPVVKPDRPDRLVTCGSTESKPRPPAGPTGVNVCLPVRKTGVS